MKWDIEKIVKEVYSELGPGYSERVYHNAVEVILREKGIPMNLKDTFWLGLGVMLLDSYELILS